MLLDSVLFYLFAILIVGSSILMITRRNVVYAAVWLINALIGTAGLFLLQAAEFLAGVQVIVYIGGITVLYLFVIMLVPLREEMLQRRFASQGWIAVICSTLMLLLVSVFLFRGAGSFQLGEAAPPPAEIGQITTNSEQDGQALFSRYLLPFEMASILLLVAIIGAIVMSKALGTPRSSNSSMDNLASGQGSPRSV
jgi:NADH-quinone oxidoreductase subunit J